MDSHELAYILASRPPRCLAGFVATPVTISGIVFDGHASSSALNSAPGPGVTIEGSEHFGIAFALTCLCGGRCHEIYGYRWANPDYRNQIVFLSPIALQCEACGSRTDLFDSDVHGYDAEQGVVTNARAKGDPATATCLRCGQSSLEAIVRFEYSDGLFEMDDNVAGREQEFFSWFHLLAKCPRCLLLQEVTDFECD
jgi:hypothetical protein